MKHDIGGKEKFSNMKNIAQTRQVAGGTLEPNTPMSLLCPSYVPPMSLPCRSYVSPIKMKTLEATRHVARGGVGPRMVDIRLPGKRNSNSHGARPVC